MRKNEYLVNILLAVIMALMMVGFLVARTVYPILLLPARSIPNLIIACVMALVAAEYLNPGAKYNWFCSAILAGLTLGLFPFVAGIAEVEEIWLLVLTGTASFLFTERMFTSILDRIASGPRARLAPLSAGLVICLIGQIFAGMIL